MKNKISKIKIFKKCKNKLCKWFYEFAHGWNERKHQKIRHLANGYTEEVKKYLGKRLQNSHQAFLREVVIEVLPLGTLIRDRTTPNLIGDEKVLRIEMSSSGSNDYGNLLWKIGFNFLYLTEQVTSDDDKFMKYMYQVTVLLSILFPLNGKRLKSGEVKRESIQLTSTCTISKPNSSKELQSTIYQGKVHLEKRYRVLWRAFTKNVKTKFLKLWGLTVTTVTVLMWLDII